MIETLLSAIADSAISVRIAEDPVLFPWIELVHVFAITTVFGSILLVDLRLIGLAGRDYPLASLNRAIVPLTWVAFVIAAVSGTLLFVSNPITYFANSYFRVKMLLMLGAGVNMLVFHLLTMRGAAAHQEAAGPTAATRLAGYISIAIWVAVVACGRWIGFTMAPF
jgi:hypothetical protein